MTGQPRRRDRLRLGTRRKLHGSETCRDRLERTDAQRRRDALIQMAADAVNADKPSAPVKRVHNIVWTAEIYEELLRCWADSPARILNLDTYNFTDIDGRPIAGGAAFADSLVQAIRQVVPNAARVTINMTAGTRFFTGLARLGGQLRLRVLLAQLPYTDPPLKERGYTVAHQLDGTIVIATPNGDTVG